MRRRSVLVSMLAATAFASLPVHAQDVRGRVVDERSRQAVQDAAVSLLDAEGGVRAEATTDASGFFTLSAPSLGTYTIVVVQPGYAEHRGEVTTKAGETLIPAVVLKSQAVELDPLEVEARARERAGVAPPSGFQRTSHIIAGANLARLEQQGGTLLAVARELSSLRTREWQDRTGRTRLCIQSVRAAASGLQIGGSNAAGRSDDCQWVTFVMDGIPVGGDPEVVFRELRFIGDYESVEYLPPAEAARLYGMEAASNGAIVLWSRGRGPYVSDERNRQDP